MASLAQSTCRCSGLRTAAPRRAQLAVSAKAAGGFGANSGKAKKASVVETSSGSYTLPKKSKKVDIRRELAEGPVVKAEAQAAVADDPNANWLQMATVSGFPEGKDRQVGAGMCAMCMHATVCCCKQAGWGGGAPCSGVPPGPGRACCVVGRGDDSSIGGTRCQVGLIMKVLRSLG